MSDDERGEEKELDLSSPEVVTKYKLAAEIVNRRLAKTFQSCHSQLGDFVGHMKLTVVLMPNGSDWITCHMLQELQPSKSVEDPEIKALH